MATTVLPAHTVLPAPLIRSSDYTVKKIVTKDAGKKTARQADKADKPHQTHQTHQTWKDRLARLVSNPDALYAYLESFAEKDNLDGLEKRLVYLFEHRKVFEVSNVDLLDIFVNLSLINPYIHDLIHENLLLRDLRGFFEGIPLGQRSTAIDEYNENFGDGEYVFE